MRDCRLGRDSRELRNLRLCLDRRAYKPPPRGPVLLLEPKLPLSENCGSVCDCGQSGYSRQISSGTGIGAPCRHG